MAQLKEGRLIHKAFIGFAVGVCLTLASAGSAGATGSCGNDFSGGSACGVGSPGSYGGTINADNERDYYVFYAHAGTELSAGVTDLEDPGCSTGTVSHDCGDVSGHLYDSQGNEIDSTAYSTPTNGIAVPATLDHILQATGTYYLVVTGSLNGSPLPYSLSVNASPGVHWPPTQIKKCTVHHKRVRRHHRWKRVKYRTCTVTYE